MANATRPRERKASSAKAGTITTSIAFANMAVGFLFQALIAASLGVGTSSDAFQLAWTVVTFGSVTIFSMVWTFLVPKMQLPTPNEVAILNAIFPIAVGLALAVAQVLLAFILDDGEVSTILLWSSPCIFLAGLSAAPQAIAYIQSRFALAAVGPVANGLALLGATAFWYDDLTPEKLGMALALGYVAQFFAVTVPLVWERPRLVKRSTISVWAILGITGFTLLAKFQPVVERILSSLIAEGATSALGYGQKVAQGLLTVAAFGLALTAMASLARHINAQRLEEAAGILSRTLSATVLLAAFIVSSALPLAWIATVILFLRGNFVASDAQYVADIIALQLPWVFAGAVAGVMTGYLYAQSSYLRVVGVAMVGIAGTIGVTLALAPSLPLYAVAIASSSGALLSLLWVLRLVATSPISKPLTANLKRFKLVFYFSSSLMCISTISYLISRVFGIQYSLGGVALGIVPMVTFLALCAPHRGLRREILEVFRAQI